MSVPWNSFRCADGWVIICAGNHPNWVRLCEMIGRPRARGRPALRHAGGRIAHVDEIEAAVSAWMGDRSVAEVEALLNANTIAGGSILPLHDVVEHPSFTRGISSLPIDANPVPCFTWITSHSTYAKAHGARVPGPARCSSIDAACRRRNTSAGLPRVWWSKRNESPMPRPLEGLRVLDIGISTAGPYAARLLGDLGADVIKVEPLDGENTRGLGLRYGDAGYLYHVNNYNKRSITLKLQHPRGRDLFLELVAKSDVVIENFAIGTMDKWGVGYAACREANPAIIYCSVKGFGESGPWAGLRAFDTVTQALCGLMYSTGKPGDPPLKAGPSVCDLMGAAVSSMAVMIAIAGAASRSKPVRRHGAVRHGRGRADLALADGAPRQRGIAAQSRQPPSPTTCPSTTTRVRRAASW
jgi:crotonobetainyl-CoA:carnitine CoA-transferase CaiB-like acyl-CoA transferase